MALSLTRVIALSITGTAVDGGLDVTSNKNGWRSNTSDSDVR